MRAHDEDTLIALYHRYGALVYSIAWRTLENRQDAEEVVQDVFMRVWEKSHQFDPARGSFSAWLATMTRNAALDLLRKKRRAAPEHEPVSLDDSPHLWETLPAESEDRELHARLAAALHRLPAPQQETLMLAYFEGLSQSQIADKLQRPLGTVKSHLRQAMERLRQIWLAEEG